MLDPLTPEESTALIAVASALRLGVEPDETSILIGRALARHKLGKPGFTIDFDTETHEVRGMDGTVQAISRGPTKVTIQTYI